MPSKEPDDGAPCWGKYLPNCVEEKTITTNSLGEHAERQPDVVRDGFAQGACEAPVAVAADEMRKHGIKVTTKLE